MSRVTIQPSVPTPVGQFEVLVDGRVVGEARDNQKGHGSRWHVIIRLGQYPLTVLMQGHGETFDAAFEDCLDRTMIDLHGQLRLAQAFVNEVRPSADQRLLARMRGDGSEARDRAAERRDEPDNRRTSDG